MNDQMQHPDLGPLNPLLDDDNVTEIMVNSWDNVFVERRGDLLEEIPGVFANEGELWAVVEVLREIAAGLGRTLDDRHPLTDLRMAVNDLQRPFARVNVVLPPISAHGPTITILKNPQFRLSADDLIRFGAWDERFVVFLRACIAARCTVVVGGGVSAGKTTVLNILTGFIPPNERVITVENALELQLSPALRHVVRLESRPPDAEGQGEVTIRDLVINALRMRPDRLLLGEVRSSEILDVLQAINTGHEGTMFSVHAGSVRDIFARLEVMCTMHPIALPLLTIRQMLADAIDIVTYQQRLPDGRRKILKIAEVTGMQGDTIALQDLFEFRQTGEDDEGHIQGHFTATGALPTFLRKIETCGVPLPDDLFTPR